MIFVILNSQLNFESFLAACLERNLLHFEHSAESSAGRIFRWPLSAEYSAEEA